MDSRIFAHDEQGAHVVALVGEFDLASEAALGAAITKAFGAGSRVVLDLTEATFIDSTVLHLVVLANTHARSVPGHEFAVVAAPGTFPESLLKLVGADQQIPVVKQRRSALRSPQLPIDGSGG